MEMDKKGELLFLTISESDYVTKLQIDNVYGGWHFLFDGVMRARDIMIGDKPCSGVRSRRCEQELYLREEGRGCSHADHRDRSNLCVAGRLLQIV